MELKIDPGPLRLDPAQGDRLTDEAYDRDFAAVEGAVRGVASWRFEPDPHPPIRPDDASWDALIRGDQQEALRLLQDERTQWQETAQADRQRGAVFRRVRVVNNPISAYTWWELHSLRVQAQCGMPIRVIHADQVTPLGKQLPDVVVIGRTTVYQALYNDAGHTDGAVRYRDPALAEEWASTINLLYTSGEDLIPYFEREIARLPFPGWKEAKR